MLFPLTVFVPALLTPQTVQQLDAGQVITQVEPGNEPLHHVWCQGIVNAPPSRVWDVLTDFADYDHIYTGIKRSEIRGRTGNTLFGYFLLEFPWPLPERWTLNETRLHPGHLAFDWDRVDGTVKRYEGSLELYPWENNKTRMVFRALMDPGLNFVPGWLVDYVASTTLPGIIQGARDYLARTANSGTQP
ncbi:MAG: SRPBCC family protein [Cyanobacteria bacterium REEB65]|nr:SRPBCC family protein [Cyanobacteria bacterium REEB65]